MWGEGVKRCCPSPCFTLLLWIWMWVEIENGLTCHFLVPNVRFSVRKVKVKFLSSLYWKLLLFLAPWIYSDWPEDMLLVLSMPYFLLQIEKKCTLLIPIPLRHEKRGLNLKGYLNSWTERYYDYKGILGVLWFMHQHFA